MQHSQSCASSQLKIHVHWHGPEHGHFWIIEYVPCPHVVNRHLYYKYRNGFQSSLKSNFSQWSFGVLLWEIITRGVMPYSHVDPRDQLRHLKGGGRLDKPRICPDALWVYATFYQHCGSLQLCAFIGFDTSWLQVRMIMIDCEYKPTFRVKSIICIQCAPNTLRSLFSD